MGDGRCAARCKGERSFSVPWQRLWQQRQRLALAGSRVSFGRRESLTARFVTYLRTMMPTAGKTKEILSPIAPHRHAI